MALEPTRSACFQPDNYRDLALFANRHVLLDDFVAVLKSFLDPDGPGEGRVLVRGHRGVGKSMLVRKAIDEVVHSLHVLDVEVDCAETVHGPEAVLRRLARTLADAILEHVNDGQLRGEGEMLRRLADATRVKVREVRQWSTSLKLGASAVYKLADRVQFEFGLTRATGRSREVEETSDRAVDATLLHELVHALLSDCARQGVRIVIFVDNLDQAGFVEIGEDVRRVTDLARALFSLGKCLVVATIRTEFVSADLAKLHSYEMPVRGMTPEELCEVATKRMESCGTRQRTALREARFDEVARTLSRWMDNAWGFLTWLAALDYAPFDAGPDDPEGLRRALLPLAQQQVPGLRAEELETIARAFAERANGFLQAAELDAKQVGPELRDRAVKYGALVPDWLLSPDRYVLSPRLHFLVGAAAPVHAAG
jgi:hypothetical protein